MSDAALAKLARAAGLNIDWTDADGRAQHVAVPAQRALLEALGHRAGSIRQIAESLDLIEERQRHAPLPALLTLEREQTLILSRHFQPDTPFLLICEGGERIDGRLDHAARLPPIERCGYHKLLIGGQQLSLAVAPPTCQSVAELTGRRYTWGLTAQLYSLRRPGDGGLGDSKALEILARSAAQQGADALAISPTHAMFAANRDIYSPYSPSSRLLFNVLYAAPASILGEQAVGVALKACALEHEWGRLEGLSLIDWPAVASARQALLRALYAQFGDSTPQLTEDFQRFRREGGEVLQQHCRFEALHAHMLANGHPGDWRNWPEQYRNPAHAAVQDFAVQRRSEVDYHAFCQWLIGRCLARAQNTAYAAGMKIGLIADLAVGADGAGSQAWARQDEFLHTLNIGAPPDILNRSGQDWGLSAFSPEGLQRNGYRAFIEMLQANLAHAGGLRIDHIMGLKRLWVFPRGSDSRAGAYLNYPFTELLRLICLESWRSRALIVGEDLGTVPEGLREDLAQRHILGMRVLQFEQRDGRFIAPEDWPDDALATTTTHDLPSMCGWLSGRDIQWRQAAGHESGEQSRIDRQQRERDKAALHEALCASGQLPGGEHDPRLQLDACIGFIASTPAPLVLLPLEDALGQEEQANLPGPGDKHPNWRRRWALPVDSMLDTPAAARRLKRLRQTRQSREEPRHD
nr:4-alpha-glucanotransferase [uncultured Pseudomonas sp.]